MTATQPLKPLDDVHEAARRLDMAEAARERALRAWEVSDEPYQLSAAVALEAAERDLRIARKHLESVRQAMTAAASVDDEDAWADEKSWGSH